MYVMANLFDAIMSFQGRPACAPMRLPQISEQGGHTNEIPVVACIFPSIENGRAERRTGGRGKWRDRKWRG
jgi:hypothetical protein